MQRIIVAATIVAALVAAPAVSAGTTYADTRVAVEAGTVSPIGRWQIQDMAKAQQDGAAISANGFATKDWYPVTGRATANPAPHPGQCVSAPPAAGVRLVIVQRGVQVSEGLRIRHPQRHGGAVREVCLAYVPDVQVGEYVIVHVGFAISKVDEVEAHQTLQVLREMGDLVARELDGTP